METIGDRIARIRKSKGLTQTAVAEGSGLKPYEISRVERGKRRPTLQTLELIAKGLTVEFDKLVEGTDAHHYLAVEHQSVPRDQHEKTLAELVKAQAELVEVKARLQAAEQQGQEQIRQYDQVCAELSESRATAEELRARLGVATARASECVGELRESRQHVFQLQQTVQGQAAHIEGLELSRSELEHSLWHAQGQYNVLHESHRRLLGAYRQTTAQRADLSRQLAAKETTGVTTPLLAGLIGLGIGALVASDD